MGWRPFNSGYSFSPKALKKNDFSIVENFEKAYEPIGLPALLVLVISGISLALIRVPELANWFTLKSYFSKHIILKLVLLATTLALAIHARFFLIPKRKLKPLAAHIILVTLVSILFVLVGVSFRTGLLF
ncbi:MULTISPECIES: CopD family protein [unclassified Tenacibaculum]|uniref:CopD family protein n=1 Tax=unclassified Tenacibaculum TaxID=2635139 RepID=UPI001F3968FC|nr:MULTISPECIES: CopD family protein [unclassified Tenacibaculum]MCF2875852.1 CopD family protein [Tenacibaculum sp. Cn5-1]MCF2935927.1 CopD family protein [Tenacibaculum sp. Cn5-34]MCG7512488.1 CopD family protein [Tenacibaculum sp. Cn5-46]